MQGQLETVKVEAKKEFSKEKELTEKVARLGKLNILFDLDKIERVLLDEDNPEGEVEELASVKEEMAR